MTDMYGGRPCLPIDVLYEIFQNLAREKHTLHSCLLANRNWCCIVAPILWRTPFSLIFTNIRRPNGTLRKLNPQKYYEFFQIWLCGIPKKAFGILSLNFTSTRRRNSFMFEYLTFVQEVSQNHEYMN